MEYSEVPDCRHYGTKDLVEEECSMFIVSCSLVHEVWMKLSMEKI